VRLRTRAVAWDIDGTLIDSEPLHEAVLLEVCALYGADLSDLAADQFRGVHMPGVWRALRPRLRADLQEAEWHEAIVSRYMERARELRPLPGAIEVMQRLAEAGLRQVCVSNSGRSVVDANLRALRIDDLLDFSISLDDVAMGKPDPDPYVLAARRLGLRPDEIAAVEDSFAGAASAHDAGMRVFAISPSGAPVPRVEAVLRGLGELPDLIRAWPVDAMRGGRTPDGL
jgi:HAD superfamily hydrolase (TIGR01509 family)